ncbi:hypothetical protein E2140_14515, partial [Listeria monocytogenes]|nr:hypothetical protein [Listeria monocytogenes]EAC4137626.1 hypothetical protein [Listeria monocytogenes]EAC4779512.1 hypothetical protein [Listeria monocytogenes]EAC9429243.1 hypothetical protein [Listeria monocytogenes]EAD5622589.1 hypothetical protein [Listeria monocytogenes]
MWLFFFVILTTYEQHKGCKSDCERQCFINGHCISFPGEPNKKNIGITSFFEKRLATTINLLATFIIPYFSMRKKETGVREVDEIRERIRKRFGDISPAEMAEILKIDVKKNIHMEGGSKLAFIDGSPVILIGYRVSLLQYPKCIAKEIRQYLSDHPSIMES